MVPRIRMFWGCCAITPHGRARKHIAARKVCNLRICITISFERSLIAYHLLSCLGAHACPSVTPWQDQVVKRTFPQFNFHGGSHKRPMLHKVLDTKPPTYRSDRSTDRECYRLLLGTFLPFLRALDRPMAMACFRLFTFPPLPPL